MAEINAMSCCGLGEIDDLSISPRDTLMEVAEDWFDSFFGDYNGTFLVFSSTNKRGHKLAAYIKKNKLGEVVTPRAKVNPNSNNMLKVWMWRVNLGGFKKWARERGMVISNED